MLFHVGTSPPLYPTPHTLSSFCCNLPGLETSDCFPLQSHLFLLLPTPLFAAVLLVWFHCRHQASILLAWNVPSLHVCEPSSFTCFQCQLKCHTQREMTSLPPFLNGLCFLSFSASPCSFISLLQESLSGSHFSVYLCCFLPPLGCKPRDNMGFVSSLSQGFRTVPGMLGAH